MNNNRRLGLIMIITGATLWGLSGPMIQWLFQHTKVSSIDFLVIRLLLAGVFILCFLLIKTKYISYLATPTPSFTTYHFLYSWNAWRPVCFY